MGTRTRIGTKGVVSTKTSDATASDAFIDVTCRTTVPFIWGAPARQVSIDIVDGQTSFNVTSSVTLATPPTAGATAILPGITGSWAGQMFTIAKMGTNALTITSSNEIKGTGSFTMTLTGSQYAVGGGALNQQTLTPFNSTTRVTFMSAPSGSAYVWYLL